jgi:hypothetical protein
MWRSVLNFQVLLFQYFSLNRGRLGTLIFARQVQLRYGTEEDVPGLRLEWSVASDLGLGVKGSFILTYWPLATDP